MRRPLRKLALLGASCAVGVGLLVPSALAGDTKPPPPPTKKAGKVTICHKTGSETNRYEVITVSRHALKAHLAHGDKFFVKKGKRGKCVRNGTRVVSDYVPTPGKDGKVAICHLTGSTKNPINVIRVSYHALKAHLANHHDGFFVKHRKHKKGHCVFTHKKPHALA